MNDECNVEKEPQILRLLKTVTDTASRVNQSAKTLNDRTAAITAPPSPEKAGLETPIDPAACQLASELMGINSILKASEATLQSILQRLEI